MQADLKLFPPTVFTELLAGEAFFTRLSEIRSQGGKVESLSWSPKTGNAVWHVTWRASSKDVPEDQRDSVDEREDARGGDEEAQGEEQREAKVGGFF